LNEELLESVKELNLKCLGKLDEFEEIERERNNAEYIIILNYIQKRDFYITELANLTGFTKNMIRSMVKNLGFIRFQNRKLVNNTKFLSWIRKFIQDFVSFLNYPVQMTNDESMNYVNVFMARKRDRRISNYKTILINAIESDKLDAFSKDIVDDMRTILQNASWGLSMYYCKELYLIYQKMFPEITEKDVFNKKDDNTEIDEPDVEEELVDDVEQIETDINYDPKILSEENQKLHDDLNESRAVCDFLTMQYDDLKKSLDTLKTSSREQNIKQIFVSFNSIENNTVLDTFFIAKSSLNDLKESGWKPSPPQLKSILFIFDLFTEFLNRQGITTRYALGEEIEITSENIINFDYTGQEIKEGKKVNAKVKSPAWYYKNEIISKARVLEVKKGG